MHMNVLYRVSKETLLTLQCYTSISSDKHFFKKNQMLRKSLSLNSEWGQLH